MTADMKKNLTGIFMYTLKLILMQNFNSLRMIFIFIICYQLSSAVDSYWQLMTADMKKNWLEFVLYTKVDNCAECQLSSLIFIFISCQQLLSAVDSWWQLLRKKLNGIFIYPLKLIFVPNFSSLGCLGAWLESVKAYGSWLPASGSHQAKLRLLRLSWACAWAWVEQKNIEIHG